MTRAGLAPIVDLARRSVKRCQDRLLRHHRHKAGLLRELDVLCVVLGLLEHAIPGASELPGGIWIPDALLPTPPENPPTEPPPVEAREAEEEQERVPFTGHAQDIEGCRTLFLEIVRRAAYDWILYRESTRPAQRALADDAHLWLFEEGEQDGAAAGEEAGDSGITSFLAICETLDLDPDILRNRIRSMTVKNVISVGRPAEYRRRPKETETMDEATLSLSRTDTWNAFGGGSSGGLGSAGFL